MRWIAVATIWQLGRLGVSEAVTRGAWPAGWLVVVWGASIAAVALTLVEADR